MTDLILHCVYGNEINISITLNDISFKRNTKCMWNVTLGISRICRVCVSLTYLQSPIFQGNRLLIITDHVSFHFARGKSMATHALLVLLLYHCL